MGGRRGAALGAATAAGEPAANRPALGVIQMHAAAGTTADVDASSTPPNLRPAASDAETATAAAMVVADAAVANAAAAAAAAAGAAA